MWPYQGSLKAGYGEYEVATKQLDQLRGVVPNSMSVDGEIGYKVISCRQKTSYDVLKGAEASTIF